MGKRRHSKIKFDLSNNFHENMCLIGKFDECYSGISAFLLLDENPSGLKGNGFSLRIPSPEEDGDYESLVISKDHLMRYFNRYDVFKIQRSLFGDSILLYNSSKSILLECESSRILRIMGEDYKIFAVIIFDLDGNVSDIVKLPKEKFTELNEQF